MKKNNFAAYGFLAPFMIGFTLFFMVPVFYSVYLSLLITRRKAFAVPVDVFGGLTNYIRAFSDPDFINSFRSILVFGLIQVPVMIFLATVFALILDETKGPFTRFFRTVIYIPYTIPSVIAGLLWGFLYSKNLSPLNFVLTNLNRDPVDFISGIILLFSVGNIVTWTWTGYNAITLYANLQNISRELYEAAKIDGATRFDVIWRIKIPLLRPAFLQTIIFSIVGTSQIFSEPFVLRSLGFIPTNFTPNTYIYQIASQDANYNYAAALAVILAIITFVFSIFLLRQVNRSAV